MSSTPLDEVDRGILFVLQQDARNTTIAEIADEVEVSSSTVRNRIDRLEDEGVIEGYYPKINYFKMPREVALVDPAETHGLSDPEVSERIRRGLDVLVRDATLDE